MSLRIRRGTNDQRALVRFDIGEPVWTSDTKQLYIGDGTTIGGVNILANSVGPGIVWNNTTQKIEVGNFAITTDDVQESETPENVWFTNARALSAISGALVEGQSQGNVTFTYEEETPGNAASLYANVTLDGVGIQAVEDDTSPALGGNLSLNGKTINGTGTINFTGTATATTFAGAFTGALTGNVKNSVGGTIIDHTTKALSIDSIAMGGSSGLVTGNRIAFGTTDAVFFTQGYSAISPWITFAQYQSANANTSNILFTRARGTLVAPTSVVSGDVIVTLAASARAGNAFSNGGSIVCVTSGTVSNGAVATSWAIVAADSAGGTNQTLTVSASGVESNKYIKFGQYNTTQRDALSTASPTNFGMVIYNTTVDKFQGWQNTGGALAEWVDLS